MKRKHVLIAFSAIAAIAYWFLAVDRSWFIERCPTCGYMCDVMQIRVCGIAVYEQRRNTASLLQKVASDLGAPCNHPNLTRYHKHRYWGLWICACPCINGTYAINVDLSWYDSRVSAKVKAMVAANPSVRQEFVEHVLTNHDWKYWSAFVDQVKIPSEPPSK